MFDPQQYRIIDLTASYVQGVPGYAAEPARTIERDGWNALTLQLYSHAGTHMDAPPHFGVSDKGIDQYPVKQFIGPAWVVDIQIKEKQQLLSITDLGTIPDRFKEGESLLLRTGWSEFMGTDRHRNALPRISSALADWCVQKKVRMLGVEPPSVADVNNLPEVTAIHRILLQGDVLIIEGLMGLQQITKEYVMLLALPLKIAGGDGAPARVIVMEDKE